MDYIQLRNYIERRMLMQHIYQPAMIKTLLKSKEHRASVEEIARQFLINDEAQLQYYKYVTKVMPGRVLKSHDVVRYSEDSRNDFVLNVKPGLTRQQVNELTQLCDNKIEQYERRYGRKSIWHSKFAGAKHISGPLQYEVLKRAKGRCELCGISREVKALQVDHIIPRSRGGLTVLENLQALCYTCNAQKQNKDATDFRNWAKLYAKRDSICVFCSREVNATFRNSLAVAFPDKYPVTQGHTLISPLRHAQSFFELGAPEQKACFMLLDKAKHKIAYEDRTVTGFNLGINDGIDAGQTVMHCHIHLIPRRKGDVADPRGGIRHIIPGRGTY